MPEEKAASSKINNYLQKFIYETNRLEVFCAKWSTVLASDQTETLLTFKIQQKHTRTGTLPNNPANYKYKRKFSFHW
ncbi:unnamed protein product, partial [Ceratitis capitata]